MRLYPFHRWSLASTVVMLLTFWCAAGSSLPSEKTVESFRQARTVLNDDPDRAYGLAVQLPEIENAEDVRIALLAESSMRSGRVDESVEFLKRLARVTEDRTKAFGAELGRAELLLLLGRVDDADRVASRLVKRRKDARGRGRDRRFLLSRLLRLRHDIALAKRDGEPGKTAKSRARRLLVHYPA